MFLTETYNVWDTLKYDNAISSDYNDIWSSISDMTRESEYTALYNASAIVKKSTSVTGDIIIELDIMSSMTSGGVVMGFMDTDKVNINTLTLSQCGMTTGNWSHVKLIIDDSLLTIEDTSIVDEDITGFSYFYLRSSSKFTTYFKNLRIYST